MRPYIESQIIAKQDQLLKLEPQLKDIERKRHDLERQKLTVETELRTYEAMLEQLSTSGSKAVLNGSGGAKSLAPAIPSEMTPAWRKILCGLDGLGRTFSADDIVRVSESVGAPTKIANARAQIYQWDKKHIIVRVRKGKYRIAQKGIEVIGKSEGSDALTSEPS